MTCVGMLAPLMIAGAGISMAIPTIQSAVINAVGPGDLGQASGVFSTMRRRGGVFGLAIVVAVFTGSGSYASAAAFGDGFAPALATSAAFSLGGALITPAIPAVARAEARLGSAAAVADTAVVDSATG